MSSIKKVLKNFAIFIGKQLCWTLFNKFACFEAGNFVKKRLQHRCFPVNIAKVVKIICEQLLLNFIYSK